MSQVLIVESDAWLAESYAVILQSAGHEVRQAGSSEEAIEAIDQTPPDVLLLDENLRGAGGIELIHELRSYPDLASIPVILCVQLTHEQLEPFRSSLKAYGISEVLQKAELKPDQLIKAVTYATAKN